MPSAKINNTTPYTTYNMRVQARNTIGTGPISGTVSAQFNTVAAEFDEDQSISGEFLDFTDPYGVMWRIARFDNDGFARLVLKKPGAAQLLVVGGGGGGGGYGCGGTDYAGGKGGSGGFYYQPWQDLEETQYDMDIGVAGRGGGNQSLGTEGGDTVFGDVVTCGGGGRGAVGCSNNNSAGKAGTFGGLTDGGIGAQGTRPTPPWNGNLAHDVYANWTRYCRNGSSTLYGSAGNASGKNTNNGNAGHGIVEVRVIHPDSTRMAPVVTDPALTVPADVEPDGMDDAIDEAFDA